MRAFASRTGWRRRAAGAAVGLLTAATAGASPAAASTAAFAASASVSAGPAEALVTDSAYTDTLEVNAGDAVAAAIAFSRLAFPDGADEVVLAGEDGFADAFASGLLQADRPLLLTAGGRLDPRTAMELRRLRAGHVIALGGEAALSARVLEDLGKLGVPASRLAGPTRVETAVAIAADQAPDAPTAILAHAWPRDEADTAMFVDAMVAGGWSASEGWPVLLTGTGRIAEATAGYLERAGVQRVHVVGGRAAVSEAAAAQLAALGIEIARVSGPSRYDTGAEVAAQRGAARRYVLVDGDGGAGWAAGFAAAAYSARFDAPILPVSRDGLSGSTAGLLRGEQGRRGLVCGPGVPLAVCHRAAEESGQVRRAEAALQPAKSGVLTGEISNPGGVSAIKVIGCGVKETVTPDANGQFSLPVTGDGCRLTVRIEHVDGTTFDQAFTLIGGGIKEHRKAPVVEALPLLPEGGLGVPDGGDGDGEDDSQDGRNGNGDGGDGAGDGGDGGEGGPGGNGGAGDGGQDGVSDGSTEEPSADPSEEPSEEPTADPTEEPTEPDVIVDPGGEPTEEPTPTPTPSPTSSPTPSPSPSPTTPTEPDVGCQAMSCGPSLPGGGGVKKIEMM